MEHQDNNEDYINEDRNNYDVGWGSGPAKRHRVAMLMTLADNHVLDDDNLCQDSAENQDYGRDNGGGGRRTIAEGARARKNLSSTTMMVW